MPWMFENEEWLEKPIDEERKVTPFFVRGSQLLKLWAKYCLTEMELKLRIGYACDAITQKRLMAVIGVVINGEELIDFTCEELEKVVNFLRTTRGQTVAGISEKFAAEYLESLEGFIESLETGIAQAKQFEPNNIN